MNAFNRKVKILTPLAFKIMFLGGILSVTNMIQEDNSLRENVKSNSNVLMSKSSYFNFGF